MGVLLAFALLVILMYKKVPILVAAPVCAALMALLSGLNVLGTLTGDYMDAMVGFIKSYFILFLICAIFGRIMDVSGAAYSIGNWLGSRLGARYAIWGVSVAAFVLTYGGVSCFVLVFAIYPIALVLFKEANISRKLIPGAIAAGAFTAPNILWGSPGLCNVIPTTYLGTTVKAAPLVSVICSIFFYLSANIYLIYENRRMQKKGECFIPTEKISKLLKESAEKKAISPVVGLVPIAVIIIVLNGFNMDVNIAMLCGVIAGYILFWKNINDKMDPGCGRPECDRLHHEHVNGCRYRRRGKDNIHIHQPGELGIQLQRIPADFVGSGSNRHIRGLRFRIGRRGAGMLYPGGQVPGHGR